MSIFRKRHKANFIKDEKGVVVVVVAIVITVLLGFSALVVDVGSLYEERRKLQTAADAAALAGVQELPDDPSAATSVAENYAQLNAPQATEVNVEILTTYIANDTIRVTLANPNTPLYFARIWGYEESRVPADATAVLSSPISYSHGVMPFGIMASTEDTTTPASAFGYEFGQSVTLKEPSQQGEQGNFQFVSLTEDFAHTGARFIYDALSQGGVPNPVYINADYYTKTGINGSQVIKNLGEWIGTDTHGWENLEMDPDDPEFAISIDGHENATDCHRLIICPIIINPEYPEGDTLRYNWSDVEGSKYIRVIEFAYFFVEALVPGQGTTCEIEGRFVRLLTEDERVLDWGPPSEYGAISFRLID